MPSSVSASSTDRIHSRRVRHRRRAAASVFAVRTGVRQTDSTSGEVEMKNNPNGSNRFAALSWAEPELDIQEASLPTPLQPDFLVRCERRLNPAERVFRNESPSTTQPKKRVPAHPPPNFGCAKGRSMPMIAPRPPTHQPPSLKQRTQLNPPPTLSPSPTTTPSPPAPETTPSSSPGPPAAAAKRRPLPALKPHPTLPFQNPTSQPRHPSLPSPSPRTTASIFPHKQETPPRRPSPATMRAHHYPPSDPLAEMITIAEGRIFSKAAEITAADKASLPRPGGSPGGAEALVRSGVGEDGGEGSGESDIFEGLRKQGVGRKRRGGDVDVDVDEDVEWMGKEVGFWRRDCEEWGGKGRGEMRREMTEKERERKGGEGSEGGIGMGMGIERGVSGGGG